MFKLYKNFCKLMNIITVKLQDTAPNKVMGNVIMGLNASFQIGFASRMPHIGEWFGTCADIHVVIAFLFCLFFSICFKMALVAICQWTGS